MKSDTVTSPKEEMNLVGKDKGKNFKKQSSGNSKHRKNRHPNKKKPKADPGNTGKCKNRGSQHKRNECPAYNKRCAYCQKWHHFASVCMAKKKGVVKFVQESQDSSDSEESVLKVEDVSSVESCGNRWFAMLSFYCEQNKLETKLKCQLDTGATCNVLS